MTFRNLAEQSVQNTFWIFTYFTNKQYHSSPQISIQEALGHQNHEMEKDFV